MNEPGNIAWNVATQAAQLPEAERAQFLKCRCGEDPGLHHAARDRLEQILASLQVSDDLLATLDPQSSINAVAVAADCANTSTPVERCNADSIETLDSYAERDIGYAVGFSADAGDDAVPTLSETEQLDISRVCEEFARAWQSDHPPRIEDFLPADAMHPLREQFAYRLMLVDMQERKRRTLPVDQSVYVSRFPDMLKTIKLALTRRSEPDLAGESDRPTSLGTDPSQHTRRSPTDAGFACRYHPIRLHARGGLGEVFLAKDMELSRLVALKRIRTDQKFNENCRQRFSLEAEITGSLEHPGIVPVYGRSRDERDGLGYAMRFIRGNSLRQAVNEFQRKHGKLASNDFAEREFRSLLRCLIDTCKALHYAHEHGVLHRDIKPDNIMLGPYGETLVVDWGLAKLMAGHPPEGRGNDDDMPTFDRTTSQTRTGLIVGTPMYMSPEQAFGLHDELTPASDVYSLGATLFYLISGGSSIGGSTSREVVANVRAGIRRNLRELVPQVPGPLASICEKAMQKSPDRRYPTASALADDIDRWLSDELVEAHADVETFAERSGRLIRKHRGWTFSAAASLLVITLVSVAAAMLIHREQRKAEKATQRTIQANLRTEHFKDEALDRYRETRDAVDTWLVQSSDAFRFFPGTQSVRMRLLTIASQDYERLASRVSEDPQLELERGRVLVRLGDLAQLRDDYSRAHDYYSKAFDLFQSDGPMRSGDEVLPADLKLDYAVEAAGAISRIALSHASLDQFESAESAYQDAIGRLTGLAQQSRAPIVLRQLGYVKVNAGELALRVNRLEDAKQRLSEGLAAILEVGQQATDHDRVSIARCEELIGRLLVRQGQYDEASRRFETAADRLRPSVETFPDNPEFLDAMSSILVSAAASSRETGRQDDERRQLSEAIEHYRALEKALPDVPLYMENLALTLSDFGLALMDTDRCRDALPYLQESNHLASELRERYGAVPRYHDQLGVTHDALGQALANLGNTGDAQLHLESAIRVYQELEGHPDYQERLAIAQSHFGQLLAGNLHANEANPDVAQLFFEQASEDLGRLSESFADVPRYKVNRAHVAYHHGWFLEDRNDSSSLAMFAAAQSLWESLGSERSPSASAQLAWMLATCPHEQIRDLPAAILYASHAVAAAPGNDKYRCILALAHLLQGNVASAESVLVAGTLDGAERTGRAWLTLAILRLHQGDRHAASDAWARGTAWFETQSPKLHDFRILQAIVGAQFESMGKPSEAAPQSSQADPSSDRNP